MRKNPTLRTVIVIGILFLITWAIADGIRYGSTWGVAMAVISMIAFVMLIRMSRKLARLKEEEEETA